MNSILLYQAVWCEFFIYRWTWLVSRLQQSGTVPHIQCELPCGELMQRTCIRWFRGYTLLYHPCPINGAFSTISALQFLQVCVFVVSPGSLGSPFTQMMRVLTPIEDAVWKSATFLNRITWCSSSLTSHRCPCFSRRLLSLRRLQPGVGRVQPTRSVWGLRRPGGAAGAFSLLPDSLSSRQHPRPAGCLQRPADTGCPSFSLSFYHEKKKKKHITDQYTLCVCFLLTT